MKIKIKNPDNIVMENKDIMINVSMFENCSLSNLQNTNIINHINRLVNMYHPDDGIAAYERLLKTLLFLSENFDSKTRQQIISTVPLPKGASNDSIKHVIYKTTGFIEIANKIKIYQKSNVVFNYRLNSEDATDKTRIHLNQNILMGLPTQNPELNENLIPSTCEVFRGFPPNEISMICSHVRNVNYMYDTLDHNNLYLEPFVDISQNFLPHTDQQVNSTKHQSNLKFKWIHHTPHILCKKNSCQTNKGSYQEGFCSSMDNKCLQLPLYRDNSYNQWNVPNIPHTLHQIPINLKKKLCNTDIDLNAQYKTEIFNSGVSNSSSSLSHSEINYCEFVPTRNQYFKNVNSNINENRISNTNAHDLFEPRFKTEQVIQEDIYKMDVVHWNEEINTTVSTENNFILDDFIINKNLKTSLQKFLRRAEHETLFAKCWKFVTQKNLENKNQLDSSMNNTNNSINTNSSECIQKLFDKKSSGLLNIHPKSTQLQVLQKCLNTAFKKSQSMEHDKKDHIENLPYKFTVKQTEQNSVNISQKSASVTELATFKKQYYDTLLNIQKAKVAVTNSLAISSVENSTKYEPHYSNCSYQQQQMLLQQHGQLTVNPQFAVHTVAQSGLSNIHNTPHTWMRYNDWKHPTVRQLRFSQQSSFQHSKNKENSVVHYVKTMNVQNFTEDYNKKVKFVQHKKLESIIGKFIETEDSNTND